MRIHLDDPARLRDLSDYLRASGCLVTAAGSSAIEASPPPRSLSAQEAERELESYLLLWRACTPGQDPIICATGDSAVEQQERVSLAQIF